MRRRRVIVVLVGLALVAFAGLLLWPHGRRPRRETFEQVHLGMTLEEVCATVGGPPGNYSSRPKYPEIGTGGTRYTDYRWQANEGTLVVIFDRDSSDRAIYTDIREPLPDNRTLLQRLRDRLGL